MKVKEVKKTIDEYLNIKNNLFPNYKDNKDSFITWKNNNAYLYDIKDGVYELVEMTNYNYRMHDRYDYANYKFKEVYPLDEQIKILNDKSLSYKDLMDNKFKNFWSDFVRPLGFDMYHHSDLDYIDFEGVNVNLIYDDYEQNGIVAEYVLPTMLYFDENSRNVYKGFIETAEKELKVHKAMKPKVTKYIDLVKSVVSLYDSVYDYLNLNDTQEHLDSSNYLIRYDGDDIILSVFKDGQRQDVWTFPIKSLNNFTTMQWLILDTVNKLKTSK